MKNISYQGVFFLPIYTIVSSLFHILVFLFASYLFTQKKIIGLAVIFFYLSHSIESTILPLELFFFA